MVIFTYNERGDFFLDECELTRYMFDGIRVNIKANAIFLHGCGDKIVPWTQISSVGNPFTEQDSRIMDYGYH